ncbi:hypothetical protein MLD38_004636 [Melastoma candidum]|uniref:Uncharacterized protein n=1 Tax=Melastoma candidum TaxID=119954 RepID=A0ACB9S5Z8_9MYRT|nr:hypothetical protein MLD38_004636 [Melastoma candidum]
MGCWFKKVFRRSKGKKRSDPPAKRNGQANPSDDDQTEHEEHAEKEATSKLPVNNYDSLPWMHYYDEWNRAHFVNPDHDVWNSDFWKGLVKPPRGGWSGRC